MRITEDPTLIYLSFSNFLSTLSDLVITYTKIKIKGLDSSLYTYTITSIKTPITQKSSRNRNL